MIDFFKKLFGKYDFQPLIERINSFEPELEKLSGEELKKESEFLRTAVQDGNGLDAVLAKAFALAREAAKRTLNQRHFNVQLIGGIVLHQGKIAEMRTGEGKTLAATAPAYLNALAGKGVHIITVNDYLARRDAIWMGQIYDALGLSVGCLTHETAFLYDPNYQPQKLETQNSKLETNSKSQILNGERDKERDLAGGFKIIESYLRPVSRKEAYSADIVYGTNHEFGFDYLRDNLAYDINQQVQRGHHYAIIDEIDSILIDEARTPLIISAPDAESSEYYKVFAKIAARLKESEDYVIDEKARHVAIADEGIDKIEKTLGIKDLYGPQNSRLVHYLEESLKAKALFKRDKHYVVKNGEIIIVDEFTGRLMRGRRYSAGLHQAIEAKEGVEVKQESRTFAQINIQNYFRMYEKISGMTGTAQTSAEEFHKVYNLEVVSVPTHKPMIRQDAPDLIYKTREAKYMAVAEEVKTRHRNGQPVLIGTASIEHNEILSDLLRQVGVPHEVLNAKNHEREGAIIAQAGKLGVVTVATNMAGRGIDIILGGNPQDLEQSRMVLESGGLHVIGTERHEARRIDNQLRGRSGRQGDSGSSQFFLSLEDDLLRIFGGEKIKNLMEAFNLPEDQPIESKLVSRAINEAQKKVEGLNFDSRKHLLEYDDVLNKQRTAFYKKRQEILQTPTYTDYTRTNTEKGPQEPISGLRQSALMTLDILWMNHLENIEELREAVGMRAYGQKEPLVEYRRESHILFKEMMVNFDSWLQTQTKTDYTRTNTDSPAKISEENLGGQAQGNTENGLYKSASSPYQSVLSPNKSVPYGKVGRNDPCPCGAKKADGSSMKYKKCHGS